MSKRTRDSGMCRVVWPLILGAAAVPVLVSTTGCRREVAAPANAGASPGPPTAPAPSFAPVNPGPLATIRRVHEERRQGRMTEVASHVVPEQRGAVIEYILSVDELTSAGESLKSRIDRHVGAGSAAAFDRTGVADTLGPFSRDMQAVSEVLDGDQAVVRLCVGGRLPLEDVHLVRRDGRWLIQTDPPIPGLAAELRKLARVLNRVADEIQRRHLSAEQITHELALRQRSILERIERLQSAAQTDEASIKR